MSVAIIADRGTHLLVRQGDAFAVVECRAGKIYHCHDGRRDGIPMQDIDNVGAILRAEDWTDETSGKAALDEIVERGTDLSEHMR